MLEYVSDLISPITGIWDEQLVRDTFYPDDARYILQIPLQEGVSDFIVWQFDRKGQHSAKSAYKLHVQMGKLASNGGIGHSYENVGN